MIGALYKDYRAGASSDRVPETEREGLIVTYVRGPGGVLHPVSRYGDSVWNFSPLFPHAARGEAEKKIDWQKIPVMWITPLKDAIATFMTVRRPGGTRLDPASMPKRLITLNAFAKWCTAKGINGFSQVSAFHISLYVQKLRDDGSADRTVSCHVSLLKRVFQMRAHLMDSLSASAAKALDIETLGPLWERGANDLRRTELIPMGEAAALFTAALSVLGDAPWLLDLRDELDLSWEGSRMSRKRWGEEVKRAKVLSAGIPTSHVFESRLTDLRTAAYIVLAMTTGCRVHELGDVRVGCVYNEILDGISYWWLKSSTRKVGDGPARWLAPEIAYSAASILERHSEPLRARLRAALKLAQERYDFELIGSVDGARLAAEIVEIRRNVDRLFLSGGFGTPIVSTDTQAHNKQLNAFAKRAGLNLRAKLSTHRFRRTYAVIIVRLNKGVRIDLATLRQHFKHASIMMTEGYVELSEADLELLELLEEEADIFDMALVGHWLEPSTPLGGGLGARIKAYPGRNHQPMFFKSRKHFIESIREGLHIRSTGHSWCLSEGLDCGGRGLFEAIPCTDCGHSVIDDSHIPVWKTLREQQQELVLLDDIGIGGKEKAKGALAASEKVLGVLLSPSIVEVVNEPV